jgi:hypothetical protein
MGDPGTIFVQQHFFRHYWSVSLICRLGSFCCQLPIIVFSDSCEPQIKYYVFASSMTYSSRKFNLFIIGYKALLYGCKISHAHKIKHVVISRTNSVFRFKGVSLLQVSYVAASYRSVKGTCTVYVRLSNITHKKKT